MTIGLSVEELLDNMDKEIEALGLVGEDKEAIKASQLLDLIGGYIGRGYSLSTKEELGKYCMLHNSCMMQRIAELICYKLYTLYVHNRYFLCIHAELISNISSKTGIVLDRVFTAKTVRGMLNEMKINPSRF